LYPGGRLITTRARIYSKSVLVNKNNVFEATQLDPQVDIISYTIKDIIDRPKL
jgi:hypothetical protein